MDVDIGNKPAMVNMVVMDGIVMGPTHCAFENCTKPFVKPMKESFVTVVVFGIVKMTRLKGLKLVRNIAMTGINIDSLKQSQAWLEYDKC
jgi:hypothetical protein